MKLIEAMKEVKEQLAKAEDLKRKVSQYCVKASFETDTYKDQAQQVKDWMQSYHDTLKRILWLKTAVQRTNLATQVTIQLGGVAVTRSITEWVYRRRELAPIEMHLWAALGDKNIREGKMKQSDNTEIDVKIVRYYDPAERDRNVELFRNEPGLIDRTLETVNAVTDVVE